jgi:hypothetical protein
MTSSDVRSMPESGLRTDKDKGREKDRAVLPPSDR